jgi:cell division protease FtsH
VPFFSISGSEFVEMFVAVGAARVHDLFEQARAKAPAIIFIDELDALGRTRHHAQHRRARRTRADLEPTARRTRRFRPACRHRAAGGHQPARDPRPRAAARTGRFDRQVLVDRPDKRGRVRILNVHVRRIRLAPMWISKGSPA